MKKRDLEITLLVILKIHHPREGYRLTGNRHIHPGGDVKSRHQGVLAVLAHQNHLADGSEFSGSDPVQVNATGDRCA